MSGEISRVNLLRRVIREQKFAYDDKLNSEISSEFIDKNMVLFSCAVRTDGANVRRVTADISSVCSQLTSQHRKSEKKLFEIRRLYGYFNNNDVPACLQRGLDGNASYVESETRKKIYKLLAGNTTALLSVYPLTFDVSSVNVYDKCLAGPIIPQCCILPDLPRLRILSDLIEKNTISNLLTIHPSNMIGIYNLAKYRKTAFNRNGLCGFIPFAGIGNTVTTEDVEIRTNGWARHGGDGEYDMVTQFQTRVGTNETRFPKFTGSSNYIHSRVSMQKYHLVYFGVAADMLKKEETTVAVDAEYTAAMQLQRGTIDIFTCPDDRSMFHRMVGEALLAVCITVVNKTFHGLLGGPHRAPDDFPDEAVNEALDITLDRNFVFKCINETKFEIQNTYNDMIRRVYLYSKSKIIDAHVRSIIRQVMFILVRNTRTLKEFILDTYSVLKYEPGKDTYYDRLRDIIERTRVVLPIIQDALFDLTTRQMHRTKPFGNITTQVMSDPCNVSHYFIRRNNTNGGQAISKPLVNPASSRHEMLLDTHFLQQVSTISPPSTGCELFTQTREGGLSTSPCENYQMTLSTDTSSTVPVLYCGSNKWCNYIIDTNPDIENMNFVSLAAYVYRKYNNMKIVQEVTPGYTVEVKHGILRYEMLADEMNNTMQKSLCGRIPLEDKEMDVALDMFGGLNRCNIKFSHNDFSVTTGGVRCKFEWGSDDIQKTNIFKMVAANLFKKCNTNKKCCFYLIPIVLTSGSSNMHITQSILALRNPLTTRMRHFHYNYLYEPKQALASDPAPRPDDPRYDLLEYTYSQTVCNEIHAPLSTDAIAFNKAYLPNRSSSRPGFGINSYHLIIN